MVSVIITVIVDALVGALAGNVTENLFEKIKGEPTKKVFKKAITQAIKRYAVGNRIVFAEPLLQKKNLLLKPKVINELAKIILFTEKPDIALIAKHWKTSFGDQFPDRDFSEDVKLLLHFFESELRMSKIFQQVFMSKDINKISDKIDESSDLIANVEGQLEDLRELFLSQYSLLQNSFQRASNGISDHILDYSYYIQEKTSGFTGRQFVFDAIDHFINENTKGYYFIFGDPGIGKTSIAAKLVKENGYPHHFNIRSEGINSSRDFLRNICAQLIVIYGLNYSSLAAEATENGQFLNAILNEVSARLKGEKCVIVIDALDELSDAEKNNEANILFLPRVLPEGIFFVITQRREQLKMRIEIREQKALYLEQDDEKNIQDLKSYVEKNIDKEGIIRFIENQKLDRSSFVQKIVDNSQGNFIYTVLILPEIENGTYSNINFSEIPIGLNSYYEDHWSRMRKGNERNWFSYKLPIILALTVVKEPVSIEQIATFSDIKSILHIREVLSDFNQFLFVKNVESLTEEIRLYRWYHTSFFEFIAAKEEVDEESVNLALANSKIVDVIWKSLNIDQMLNPDRKD